MLADEFTTIFRDEHRQVRDALLDLLVAFQERNRDEMSSLLGTIAGLTGPHFRYEEESLYPGLVDLFGAEYVEQLFGDHDRAIGSAGRLVELAGQDELSDEDVTLAVKLIRGILPHVSDCDGLSIMVERFPEEKVRAVLDCRDSSLDANLDLIAWAEQVRGRAPVSPS